MLPVAFLFRFGAIDPSLQGKEVLGFPEHEDVPSGNGVIGPDKKVTSVMAKAVIPGTNKYIRVNIRGFKPSSFIFASPFKSRPNAYGQFPSGPSCVTIERVCSFNF